MKRFDAGCSEPIPEPLESQAEHRLNGRWSAIVEAFLQGRPLRPIQRKALLDARILESRQHLVISAPTNSGKSLIGHLLLLDAVMQGRRAVLLEPLRALAQEQADELTERLASLGPSVLASVPKIRISTGDYRLESEFLSDAPPSEGEIIVATPERLDAIMRDPSHDAWIQSIGTVVVDEAHLLGDARRGPTLELLVATMLSLQVPPRIALLSATIGCPEALGEWLRPCQIISSNARTPLWKEVWQLENGEQADEILCLALREALEDPSNVALVFVYRREAAEALARKLSVSYGIPSAGYHSGQSAAERARIRAEYLAGRYRCVVTTTALAMGVNLPATHVFVRDTTFFGHGDLTTAELIQILGRAGRGDRAGRGVVLLRPNDSWAPEQLAAALRGEVLPPLQSSFAECSRDGRGSSRDRGEEITISAAALVAACLARRADQGLSTDDLTSLLGNTLGGRALVSRLEPAIRWLSSPTRVIAYRDEQGRYHLTALGRAGVRAMLPLPYIAGVGQLVRDLLSLDPQAKLLGRWTTLDHLFLASLLSDRSPHLRRFSESLANQIDGWLESRPAGEKSLLFVEWVMGTEETTKADELWGSLGLAKSAAGVARKRAYMAMLSAAILDERSRGASLEDLERRWCLSGLEGVEESWRDTVIWLLSGHVALFEVRAFYHHLRESCSASHEQIRAVKQVLGRMRRQAYDLMERLKYCSPLGPIMRGVRQTLRREGPSVGVGTIRKLEAAGFTSLHDLAHADIETLCAAGVQRRFAKQILAYVRRRQR